MRGIRKNCAGFTLIEILVAITILMVLGAIGASTYNNAQGKARDGKRKVDIENIAKSLEAGKKFKTGEYINRLGEDFPGGMPKDPRQDDAEPQYCIKTSDVDINEPAAGSWTGVCPPDSWNVLTKDSNLSSAKFWMVCALKEDKSNICVHNRQGLFVTLTPTPVPTATPTATPTPVPPTATPTTTPTPTPTGIPAIFADGFETGNYSNWTSTAADTGYTLATVTGSVKNGSYGSHSTFNNTTSDDCGNGKAQKNFAASTTNYARAESWVRFTSFSSYGYGIPGSRGPLTLRYQDDGPYVTVAAVITGTRRIQLAYRAKNSQPYIGSLTVVNGFLTMTLNTWYRLRLEHDNRGANPVLTFSYSTDGVNFTQASTATDTTAGSYGVANMPMRIDAGVVMNINCERGNYAFDHDDVAVYNAVP